MSKISGGANSFLLRSLVQALVDTSAIPPEKIDSVISRFKERVNETETAKRQPAEVLRHVGNIVAQLYPLGVGAVKPVVEIDAEFPVSAIKLSSEEKAQTSGYADTYPPGLQAVARATEAAGVAIPPFVPSTNLALDPADIDLLLDDVDVSMPPSPRSGLQVALEAVVERFSAAPRHPFIETLMHEGKRYAVVGTATIRSSKKEGVTRSANCTVKNYKRIKEADEGILVHVEGRPMCATRELDNGVCFVWLLHHTPGLVVRFWLNESDNGVRKDNPKGTYRITLSDDETGWKKAA